MTYEEKKSLYESIMKRISVELRKYLDESQIDLLMSEERDIIDDPEFKKWFSGSKCVDEDGITPMLLFYGGKKGPTDNYWFSDSNIVAKYFGSDNRNRFRKSRFHKAFVRMEHPLIVDWEFDAWSFHYDDDGNIVDTESMTIYARENGYDGLIIRDVYEGEEESYLCDDYVVFNDSQIYWIK
jgi:hypothetical protein